MAASWGASTAPPPLCPTDTHVPVPLPRVPHRLGGGRAHPRPPGSPSPGGVGGGTPVRAREGGAVTRGDTGGGPEEGGLVPVGRVPGGVGVSGGPGSPAGGAPLSSGCPEPPRLAGAGSVPPGTAGLVALALGGTSATVGGWGGGSAAGCPVWDRTRLWGAGRSPGRAGCKGGCSRGGPTAQSPPSPAAPPGKPQAPPGPAPHPALPHGRYLGGWARHLWGSARCPSRGTPAWGQTGITHCCPPAPLTAPPAPPGLTVPGGTDGSWVVGTRTPAATGIVGLEEVEAAIRGRPPQPPPAPAGPPPSQHRYLPAPGVSQPASSAPSGQLAMPSHLWDAGRQPPEPGQVKWDGGHSPGTGVGTGGASPARGGQCRRQGQHTTAPGPPRCRMPPPRHRTPDPAHHRAARPRGPRSHRRHRTGHRGDPRGRSPRSHTGTPPRRRGAGLASPA